MRWLLLLAVFAGTPAVAQDYFEGDPHWQVRTSCYWSGCAFQDNFQYWVSGDSVIDGVLWHRVLRSGQIDRSWIDSTPADPECQGSTTYGPEAHLPVWLRQVGRTMRIFIYGADRLLHDFDLNVGDSLSEGWLNTYPYQVYAVDSILIGSNMRARFWTTGWQLKLIEGVGSSIGLLEQYTDLYECSSVLNCFSLNGYGYYPTPGVECDLYTSMAEIADVEFAMWPNPALSTLLLKSNSPLGTVRIHDASGHLVLSKALGGSTAVSLDLGTLSSGVYSVHVADRPAQRLVVMH